VRQAFYILDKCLSPLLASTCSEQAAKFFEPLIQKLVTAIEQNLGEHNSVRDLDHVLSHSLKRSFSIKIVILQGGLSEMPHVMESLQKRFDSVTANVACINGCL